jgi:hypothetical protein
MSEFLLRFPRRSLYFVCVCCFCLMFLACRKPAPAASSAHDEVCPLEGVCVRAQAGPSHDEVCRLPDISVQYNTGDFASCLLVSQRRLTMQENGTDVPIDVGPAHSLVLLRDKRPLPKLSGDLLKDYLKENSISLVPLTDGSVASYSAGYPYVYKAAEELKKMLVKRPVNFSSGLRSKIPDLTTVDVEHAFYAKVRYIDFPAGSGILFLTQYTQEPDFVLINNDDLALVFQGLTKDGRFYIDAHFNLRHASLPKDSEAAGGTEKPGTAYLKKAEKQLNDLSDDSFEPSIARLVAVIQSLASEKAGTSGKP